MERLLVEGQSPLTKCEKVADTMIRDRPSLGHKLIVKTLCIFEGCHQAALVTAVPIIDKLEHTELVEWCRLALSGRNGPQMGRDQETRCGIFEDELCSSTELLPYVFVDSFRAIIEKEIELLSTFLALEHIDELV